MEVKKPAARPHIDEGRCTGCGRCVSACGERRFTLETVGHGKHAVVRHGRECPLCRKCIEECPVEAISL